MHGLSPTELRSGPDLFLYLVPCSAGGRTQHHQQRMVCTSINWERPPLPETCRGANDQRGVGPLYCTCWFGKTYVQLLMSCCTVPSQLVSDKEIRPWAQLRLSCALGPWDDGSRSCITVAVALSHSMELGWQNSFASSANRSQCRQCGGAQGGRWQAPYRLSFRPAAGNALLILLTCV